MSNVQKALGGCIRSLRESQGLTLETLAGMAGISYQYLSGLENGRKNFSIQILEAVAHSLGLPVADLVGMAFSRDVPGIAPTLNPAFFRRNVPLPPQMTIEHIEKAANDTQFIINRMNFTMKREVGASLQVLIQGNNFSGLVSNLLTCSLDKFSPYKHNHDQRYPDLINSDSIGLEVKTTINIGKGGESHNGHKGWHLVACYRFITSYDIEFIHLMLANLNGHQDIDPDWKYLGSKINMDTGSRRTETYNTNHKGTTKLRDGSVYFNFEAVDPSRWKQERSGALCPAWSIFAK